MGEPTPGPWQVHHDQDEGRWHVVDGDGWHIMSMAWGNQRGFADARLAAAAHELLAFAEMMVHDWDEVSTDTEPGCWCRYLTENVQPCGYCRASAAIAKATGQEVTA